MFFHFVFLFVGVCVERVKGKRELRVFFSFKGYSPLCFRGEGIERKRGKKGGEKGVWMKEKG